LPASLQIGCGPAARCAKIREESPRYPWSPMSPLLALPNFGSIAGLALLLWIFWIPAWQRRRAEAPLRTELRARPAVDFSTKVMSKALLLGSDLPMRDSSI
jgi:hypothetical protein